LRYAGSDAQKLGQVLNTYGFKVKLLVGASATRAKIIEEMSSLSNVKDLAIVYFAGMTARSADGDKPEMLKLIPFDYDAQSSGSGILIAELKQVVGSLNAAHKLVILDGCHGTTGLTTLLSKSPSSVVEESRDSAVMFHVGTQDSVYGMESFQLGGSAFTQSLLRALDKHTKSGETEFTLSDIFRTTGEIMKTVGVSQHPQLVRVSGSGEIVWTVSSPRLAAR
jgi:hypothetical protein